MSYPDKSSQVDIEHKTLREHSVMAKVDDNIDQNISPASMEPSFNLYSEDNYSHKTHGLVYIESSCTGPGLDLDLYETMHNGCKCCNLCITDNDCSCLSVCGQAYDNGKLKENFLLPVFECNEECNCDCRCNNRITQRGPRQGLSIECFPLKGFGLITSLPVPSGAFVCEYAGEYIGVNEAKKRFATLLESDSNYILIMKEHMRDNEDPQLTIIDPTFIGNIGRYINHSCDPNLEVIPVRVNSFVPIAGLFAKRDIKAGEELCYDYNGISGRMRIIKPNFIRDLHHENNDNFSQAEIKCDLYTSSDNCFPSTVKELIDPHSDKVTSLPTVKDKPERCENLVTEKKIIKFKPCLCVSVNCRKFLPYDNSLS